MENAPSVCPTCHRAISSEDYFCPNCGKNLKAKPLSVSIATQIGIYLLSVFLPPLGLWPAIKYLKEEKPKVKRVGIIAIVLTITSLIVATWLAFTLFENYLNQFNSSLNGLQ